MSQWRKVVEKVVVEVVMVGVTDQMEEEGRRDPNVGRREEGVEVDEGNGEEEYLLCAC